MVQTSFALMTNLGLSKEAAALANGTTITVTHIAIGDGATVPSGGETELYNEVARKTISGHGTVVGATNVAYFDCFLAAADGPYTIREAGLYDDDDELIAIAHYDPPINKPTPSSGQTVEGTVRLEVAFSDVANVTIEVDPSLQVPLQRITRLPWVPVLSLSLSTPPASPSAGDTYLIAADATGAWAGQDGKLAEYGVAGWAIMEPPNGHGVGMTDGSVYIRIDGAYVPLVATETFKGLVELATVAEAIAGTDTGRAVTPAGLLAGIRRQNVVYFRGSQGNTSCPNGVATLTTGFDNIGQHLGDTTYLSGVFTIGAEDAGKWLFWGGATAFNVQRLQTAIMRNGAAASVGDDRDTVDVTITTGNINLIDLAAGDTIQLQALQLNSTAVAQVIQGFLMGIRIGK